MPLTTTCSECEKKYTFADGMNGKRIKCKECGNTFTVEATANGKPKTAAPAAKGSRPAVKRNDEDDEKSAKARPKKKGGMGMWLLLGGGVAVVMLFFVCAGGGIGAYLLFFRGHSVSKENFDKLKGGMTQAQVKEILGKPDQTVDGKDLPGGGGTFGGLAMPGKAEVWESGKNSITVSYINDKVAMWTGTFNGATYTMTDTGSFMNLDQKPGKNPPRK